MAYGMWPGLQQAIPGGINIAHGMAQYENQQQQLAINKIKHQQLIRQEEEMNKPVAKEFFMSSFGVTDATPSKKKYVEQLYSNLDPEDKGFTTQGAVKTMMDLIEKDKSMQGGFIQSSVDDAKLNFETSQKKYDAAVQKAQENGVPIAKDEKIQQLKEQRDRMHDVYGAVYAKAQGAPAGFTENQKMERMIAGKEEDYRKMQAQQGQMTERAMAIAKENAELKVLLKQYDERIKAAGEAGKNKRAENQPPKAGKGKFISYLGKDGSYHKKWLPEGQSYDLPEGSKEITPSKVPAPSPLGGIFGAETGPKASYKDVGNGVLQYIRPGE